MDETELATLELEAADEIAVLEESAGGITPAPYYGEYTVTPKVQMQTMETADKYMTDNVTILAIPYYSVDNQKNGQTVIIGGS